MPSNPPDPRKSREEHARVRPSPSKSRDKLLDRDLHKPSRPHRTSQALDRDRDDSLTAPSSSDSSQPHTSKRRVRMVVPEMERRKASDSQPASQSYPSFSKAHSREAVRSLDDVRTKPITPDATDVSRRPPKSASPNARANPQSSARAPPSPPLTAEQPDLRRARSGASIRRASDDTREGSHTRRKSVETGDVYKNAEFSASRSSLRQAEEGASKSAATPPPPKSGFLNMFKGGKEGGLASGKKSPFTGSPVKGSHRRSGSQRGSLPTDSDATSIAPERKGSRKPPTLLDDASSPPSDNDDSPRTPEANQTGPPRFSQDRKQTPMIEVFASHGLDSDFDDFDAEQRPYSAAPPPPPPPPPAVAPAEAPRVDYLLQYGGLSNIVPKQFASAANPPPPQTYQQYMSPQIGQTPRHIDLNTVFNPYHKLLDSFSNVISKNGSVAVATGYRSVARRLLDRLEHVFARNISSEICTCVMCKQKVEAATSAPSADPEDNGVSWGEVLELVSGRRDLPPWPPFSLATSNQDGLGIEGLEHAVPMQKLDMDVPEEYRDHYIRQSKKTKQAVDKWLASQPESQPSPPSEVDDETLTFAMLTYLESSERRIFTALLRGLQTIPDSRAPTPLQNSTSKSSEPDLLSKTGLALQRLYRLQRPPREPECAMYLLKNPTLHSALATLAAISNGEWEILISGRFDGFLWSGAEDSTPTPSTHPSRGPSRNPTPLSAPTNGHTVGPLPFRPPSRAPTPGGTQSSSNPVGPVQVDEETEIAVLAEVEREIYLGMEALEDAFEALHSKAEGVRRALRERSAGLAVSAQARRPSVSEDDMVRLGTPASQAGGFASPDTPAAAAWPGLHARLDHLNHAHGGVDEDGLEERSELAPDDSASNVGWREKEKRSRYKKRRPGASRRTERRTPAPVEEEDEVDDGIAVPRRR